MDISDTIRASSDQLNADDLIGGDIMVRVEDVRRGSAEQPVEVVISGGHQPWRPCKTSRRVLAAAWGTDTTAWVGRWVTLYRDEHVTWGGRAVGGVRIRALSHIDGPLTVSLAVSRGKKQPRTVRPMNVPEMPAILRDLPRDRLDAWLRSIDRPPLAQMSEEQRRRMAEHLAAHPDLVADIRGKGEEATDATD